MNKRVTKRRTTKPMRPKAVRVRAKASSVAMDASAQNRTKTESAYLASIAEYSQDGMVRCTLDAIIQSWNMGAQRIFGYTPDEVIGKHISVLAPADRAEEPRRTLAALNRGKQVPPYETVRQRKDRSLVNVEVSVSVIREGNRPVATAAVYRDISKRKRVEEALRVIEERYALVEQATNDGVWDWNPLTGEDYLSPRWKALLGFEDHELPNRDDTFFSLIHPDDLNAVRNAVHRHIELHLAYDIDVRLRCKDGGYRWFNTRGRAIRNDEGKFVRMLGAITDITGRKQAEAALAESERRLREAQSVGRIGDWQFDVLTQRISWSDAMFRLFERDPALGPPGLAEVMAYYFPEDCLRLEDHIRRAIETGEGYAIDLHLRLPGGEERYHHAIARVQKDSEEKVVRLYGVAQDITERKRAEDELRRLNAELERRVATRTASLLSSTESLLLSATALRKATDERRRLEAEIIEISEAERQRIGHDLHDDLGQQLAGLSWLSSVLEQKLQAQSSPETGSAARIAELLGNALNLTRSLARGLQPVPAESGGLMAALSGMAARSAELFKVGCRFTCRKPVHFQNPKAATHLYRIAQEAVTNAVKHGQAKQIRITLSASRGKLLLTVADDGDGWKKPDPAHDGLGVRIMRYRAETLGGSLAFHKTPGGGTRVACTIPMPAESTETSEEK